MATRPRTYTIDELERLSGIDRRTIAYYVQEGLLPRIGRRGPRTRYPQLFLDRLLFIRQQREREDAGELEGTRTLAEIRELFEREDGATVAAAVRDEPPEPWPDDELATAGDVRPHSAAAAEEPAGGPPPADERIDMLLASPPAAMSSFAARARRLTAQRADQEGKPETVLRLSLAASAPPPAEEHFSMGQEPVEDQIAGLLAQLDAAADRRERGPHRGSEHWTRAAITDNLTVSARDITEEDACLLERLAEALRRLLERRRRW